MFRRVPPVLVVSDPKVPGGLRASSSAFCDDPDGSPMSVYAMSIVTRLGLDHTAVVYGKESGWGVAQTPVELLAEEEQQVLLDPVVAVEVPHPCDPAHGIVVGDKQPKSRRERIARGSPLVHIVHIVHIVP